MPQPCRGSHAYSHVVTYGQGKEQENTDVETFNMKEAGVWLTNLPTEYKWKQLATQVTVHGDCQYVKVGDL